MSRIKRVLFEGIQQPASASDQPAAQRQQLAALGVRQKAEVANAVESAGQHMQQEAAQDRVNHERQEPLLVAVGRSAPTEGDLALLERDQVLVRDRHTVGVAVVDGWGLPCL